jgi:hypothetical protein
MKETKLETVRRSFEFSAYDMRVLKAYSASRGDTLQSLITEAIADKVSKVAKFVNVPASRATKTTKAHKTTK